MIISRGFSHIVSIEEKFENYGGYKDTVGETVIERRSVGWWVRITNSAAIRVGSSRPEGIKVGDKVLVTLETLDA